MQTKKFTLNEKELTELFSPLSTLLLRALSFRKWSLIGVHERDNASSYQAASATIVSSYIPNAQGVFKALQRHGKQLSVKDLGKGSIHIYKAAIIAQQTMDPQFIFTSINKYDKEKRNVKIPESTKSSAWGRQRHINVLTYYDECTTWCHLIHCFLISNFTLWQSTKCLKGYMVISVIWTFKGHIIYVPWGCHIHSCKD